VTSEETAEEFMASAEDIATRYGNGEITKAEMYAEVDTLLDLFFGDGK
jgi:hypothetical protein